MLNDIERSKQESYQHLLIILLILKKCFTYMNPMFVQVAVKIINRTVTEIYGRIN